MKVLIIGGVAAGTKTAAKLKRADRGLEVTILTKDQEISYAGCGLPYYVGGAIEDRADLVVNTPQQYEALTGVRVLVGREAVALEPKGKVVTAQNLQSGLNEQYPYDKLVIATGASSIIPPVEGVELEGVFTMRKPEDAIRARAYLQNRNVQRAVVVGGGFIGLEIAENLLAQGVAVTVVDFAGQVLPNVFDAEIAGYVKRHLEKKKIRVLTGTRVERLNGEEHVTSVTTSAGELPADLVVLSAGIRPNTEFLQDSGIEMVKGAIVTGKRLETNLPDVYAVGDCALVYNRITGEPQWGRRWAPRQTWRGVPWRRLLPGRTRSTPACWVRAW